MQFFTGHEFAAQHQEHVRHFNEFNTDYVVSLLADIHSRIPEVREVVFHGHELKSVSGLRKLGALETVHSVYAMQQYNNVQPDQWMQIDIYASSAERFAEIMHPYESGMLYIPAPGTSVTLLGELIVQQTCGLGSLFRPKTYKNLLAMDVFVSPGSGLYVISD